MFTHANGLSTYTFYWKVLLTSQVALIYLVVGRKAHQMLMWHNNRLIFQEAMKKPAIKQLAAF